MTTVILLAASILVAAIVAWLLRRRLAALTLAYVPRKETMTTALLFAPIALLLVMAILPDILLLFATSTLCHIHSDSRRSSGSKNFPAWSPAACMSSMFSSLMAKAATVLG